MRSTLSVCTLLLAASTMLAAQSPQSDAPKPDQIPASQLHARPPYAGQTETDDDPGRGIEIFSDTQGVDFKPYLAKIGPITRESWDRSRPKEVPPEIQVDSKVVGVQIRASILPNGRLEARSMQLVGRSGSVTLVKAAWGAIVTSSYPPLPAEFKGARLTIQFNFGYILQAKPDSPRPAK